MPLSDSNIRKLSESGDIDGLGIALKSGEPQTRVEAAEALMEIGTQKATNLLTKEFRDNVRFGNVSNKLWIITMMQGRSGLGALVAVADALDLPREDWRSIDSWKIKFRMRPALNLVRPILYELATNEAEAPAIRWYAVVALAELGDRSDEVMQLLLGTLDSISHTNRFIKEVTVRMFIRKQTVRTMSFFANNPDCVAMLVRIQKGELFEGGTDTMWRSAAIYALGASGNASAREYLEYLASHGNEVYRKGVRISLELFGKATYDEIEAKVESKGEITGKRGEPEPKEEQKKGGFFKKLFG